MASVKSAFAEEMKLLLLLILSTIVLANHVETGRSRNFKALGWNKETVDILGDHFPIIHQYVNKLLQSKVSLERTAIMSNKSYQFVQYLMALNNRNVSSNKHIAKCQFNDTGNLTVSNSLTPVNERNMSLSLLDILLNYTKNLKTRYALVILQDELGVTRKQFMKQLVEMKAEILVANCQAFTKLRLDIKRYKSLILNCNVTYTTRILKMVRNDDVFIDSHSWLIACENCTAIEQWFQENEPEVIADVVLLQLSDYIEVSFKYTHSACSSNPTEVIHFPTVRECHMTRLQKTCKNAPMQHTNYLLHNNKDIEEIGGFSVSQTLSGCRVNCFVTEVPPFVIYSPKGFTGIDYEFMRLISNTLGFISYYSILITANYTVGQNDYIALMTDKDFIMPFFYTYEFAPIADISPAIAFTCSSGIIRRPSMQFGADNSLKAYLSPFTPRLWCWIALVAIATVLAWVFVRRFHLRNQMLSSNASKIAASVWNSLFDTLSVLPNQGVSELMPVTSYKMILATISLFTALYMTCYSAVLITFLSDRRIVLPFTSLEGFVNDPEYYILELNIEDQKPKLLVDSNRTESDINRKMHMTKGYHFATPSILSKGKWLYFSHSDHNEFLSSLSWLDLQKSKHFMPETVVAIKNVERLERNLVFRKGFPHQTIFFRTAKRLVEAGLYQKLRAYEMNEIRLRKERNKKMHNNVVPIEMNSVLCLMAICLIGWIMSLIVFIIELLVDRRMKSSIIYVKNTLNP